MMKSKTIALIILIFAVIVISGCISQQPTGQVTSEQKTATSKIWRTCSDGKTTVENLDECPKTGGISKEQAKVTDNSNINENPTSKVIEPLETKEVKKDPCTGITCVDSYKTCPDGYTAKCSNICSSGVCSSCVPDCSNHVACTESWSCTEWSKCNYEGKQTRYCSDSNFCGAIKGRPLEEQNCECIPDWQCLEWSSCILGKQSRACIDKNYCLSEKNKPAESQGCTCMPDWQCNDWSECTSLEKQTRTCNDINNCGSIEGKPQESQSCVYSTTPDSLESALRACYDKAKTCSNGVPFVETEFRKYCWQIYYYTGSITEIMDSIKIMC